MLPALFAGLAAASFGAPASSAPIAPSPPTPSATASCPASATSKAPVTLADLFADPRQGMVQVGEEVAFALRSPARNPLVSSGRPEVFWKQEINLPKASYVAPHFSRFVLPKGAELTVRSPDGSRSWTYTEAGKGRLGEREGFWGIHIPGSTAVLELTSTVPVPDGAVVVDKVAQGFAEEEGKAGFGGAPNKAICGTDQAQEAKCLQVTEPMIYSKSQATMRLLINGTSACTGWLVGNAGHVLTNQHCIGSASAAANTDFELSAEGASCATNCRSWFACPGTVVATSSTYVKSSAPLDYTLVQLPTNPTGLYGYLQLRNTPPVVNERIYIPGHPSAWGRYIADASTHSSDASGKCEVFSLTQPACSGGANDIGYYCDTQGGSSGSPVIAFSDHLVVSLHHCANCPNRGVPIQAVIADLGASLPPNAIGGGTPCTPPAAPTGVTATAAGVNQINLSWSAVSGATQYRIYRSTTPGGPYTLAGTATGTSFSSSGLSCGTPYYYVVRAFAGCESANSAQVTATTASCPPCSLTTLYSNGFETGSGMTDWVKGTFLSGGSTTDWRGIQTCTANAGTKVFRFGGSTCTANYANGRFAYAQPGASGINVPAGATNSRLSFWHRRAFESGYDGGTLRVSVNGGAFAVVPSAALLSGATYNGTAGGTTCQPAGAAGAAIFTGTQSTFVNTVVDLDAACNAATGTTTGCGGKTVRIGFTVIADCSVNADGWFLDDVSVTTCS